MMFRSVATAIVWLWSAATSASDVPPPYAPDQAMPRPVLSVEGLDLGRAAQASATMPFDIVVGVDDMSVAQGFVVARFQNGQPMMLTPGGGWLPWDGDPSTLNAVAVTNAGGEARFTVATWPTPDVLAPCTFTVGYWAHGQVKFGYITVDGL